MNFSLRPVPKTFDVSWKTNDGESHKQTVEGASRVPNEASFSGYLWFKFTDKGVEVSAVTYVELDERLKTGGSYYP